MIQFGNLDPSSALSLLRKRIDRINSEPLNLGSADLACGRILAKAISLDRDSPACDVSAMDGYAVRLTELNNTSLPIIGECRIGEAPSDLKSNQARRIYTGSPIPPGADTVIRLERAEVVEGELSLLPKCQPILGADIRRQGENAKQGEVVLKSGTPLTPAAISAIASIAPRSIEVHKKLVVTILTTGNELVDHSLTEVAPWQLRDSNGPTLVAMLNGLPWVERVIHRHVVDSLESLTQSLAKAVAESDAVVMTGGVSKGAYDYVSEAVKQVNGEIAFHGIMARPGRPTLGAVVDKKPVIGLPGNPLAVLTSGRRLLIPTLRYLAGFAEADLPATRATLTEWQGKTIPLAWWRPVRFESNGIASLVSLRGSGDVCGPAKSDGFVEVPPNSEGLGPHPFYSWLP